MLAYAAVIFPIGGVSGQVKFIFDTPVSAVECKQAVLICFFGGRLVMPQMIRREVILPLVLSVVR